MSPEEIAKLIAPDAQPPGERRRGRARATARSARGRRASSPAASARSSSASASASIEFVEPAARLRGRRRHGRGEEGAAASIADNIRDGKTQPRADGHPLHRADGHRQDVRGRGVREGVRADHDQAEELPLEVGRRDRGQPREDPATSSRPSARSWSSSTRAIARSATARRRRRRRHVVARHRPHQGVHVATRPTAGGSSSS